MPDRSPAQRWTRRLAPVALLGWIAACVIVGAILQNAVHLNHDVGWITHSAGWLLDGRRFGSDIIDPNPPLIWFVSLPAAALARTGWLGEVTAIRVYVWTLVLLSLALAHRILAATADEPRAERHAVIGAGAFAFAVLAGASFGQREYLAAVLGLPYILLAGMRIDGREPPPSAVAVLAGVMGGIAFCFKPYLLAVPLLTEIAVLVRTRRLTCLRRPELMALGATGLAYACSILLFAPDYLTVALPIVRATYWAYESARPESLWLRFAGCIVPAVFAAAFLAGARRLPGAALAGFSALAGYSFSYWVQRKGFVYHAYPVLCMAVVLLALAAAVALRRVGALGTNVRPALKAVLATAILLAVWTQAQDQILYVRIWRETFGIGDGIAGAPRQALIARLRELAQGRRVSLFAFSTHPFPAFPTVNYLGARFVGRYPDQFVVPAYVKRMDANATDLAAIDAAISHQRESVIADLRRSPPDIVLLDRSPSRLGLGYRRFEDLAFYSEDARFAAIWRRYREVPGVGTIAIFVPQPGAVPN